MLHVVFFFYSLKLHKFAKRKTGAKWLAGRSLTFLALLKLMIS